MDVKRGISDIVLANKAVPTKINTPTDRAELGEIVKERTANAKVFPTGIIGQRQAKVYGIPIHYHDGFGYKSIDPTVKRKPLSDRLQTHKYEVKSGAYHAHFKADKPHDYRLEVGDSFVEYEALFDESESLEVKTETSLVGVKETIILKDEKAPTRLSWRYTHSGNAILTPPPIANDANGKRVPVTATETDGILTYDVNVKGVVFPVMIDPTSVTATNDGRIMSSGSDYATTRDASSATAYTGSVNIGQYYSSPTYIVIRSFFSFAIPDMTTLTAASFFGYTSGNQSYDDFGVYIHTSTYSSPIANGDFDLFDGHQASGAYNGTVLNNTWNSSSISGTWNEIVFNASGRSAIIAKKNDTFKMVLLSKKDYDNTTPTTEEYIAFYPSSTAGKEPYLSITFTLGASIPLLTDTYKHRRATA